MLSEILGLGISTPVIELLNQSGTRLQTCGAPSYTSACLNDDLNDETIDSALDMLLSGAAGTEQTFYLHVLDWRGDARPDMQYYLSISGVDEPLRIAVAQQGLGSTEKQGSTKGVAFSTAIQLHRWNRRSGLVADFRSAACGLDTRLHGIVKWNGHHRRDLHLYDSSPGFGKSGKISPATIYLDDR